MSLKIKDFLLISLQEQKDGIKSEIRSLKKDHKLVDDLQKFTRNSTEVELRKQIEKEPELLKEYDKVALLLKDKQDR